MPDRLKQRYDLVVVGGGVTGAGVFQLASAMGLSVLLVEAGDFAWGTSSRSSKMVHGGLRYLKQGKFLLTRSAVRERERLLKVYPGLVTPLEFIMPVYDHYGPSKNAMRLGLSIYSLMAGKRQHCRLSREETLTAEAGIRSENLVSAVTFSDAQVDDARLVLRLIRDGCDQGGTALNYTRAVRVARDARGRVAAVGLEDTETGQSAEVKTPVVVNATGPFAEALHPSPMRNHAIRPLRGSHLLFPGRLMPLDRVISFIHPRDHRPVFVFPWEGCTVLGTTDVDHDADLAVEPRVSRGEAAYLMEGLDYILPRNRLDLSDAVSSIAGVRAVLSRKKANSTAASKESREHVVWADKGLVTATGGKLTTFRLLAKDALKAARDCLPEAGGLRPEKPPALPAARPDLPPDIVQRIAGRYGSQAASLLASHEADLFDSIAGTSTLWAEICHGAANEQVRHLSDLLLRRVRIGLFLPKGGQGCMDRIRSLAAPYLAWDEQRWDVEIADYCRLWQQSYAPPDAGRTPGVTS